MLSKVVTCHPLREQLQILAEPEQSEQCASAPASVVGGAQLWQNLQNTIAQVHETDVLRQADRPVSSSAESRPRPANLQ